jgi:predicted cupin superfamily sugar epimerase
VNDEIASLIAQLELEPLPNEGGFFRRTWTSPVRATPGRSAASMITFLLTEPDFSAFHLLVTDELWFFHSGDPVEHIQLVVSSSEPQVVTLGSNVLARETPQLVVPGGTWQAARIRPRDLVPERSMKPAWALVSCVMVPAWEEREFTLGVRDQLRQQFPGASKWIDALTR